jgi:hypothetical protein
MSRELPPTIPQLSAAFHVHVGFVTSDMSASLSQMLAGWRVMRFEAFYRPAATGAYHSHGVSDEPTSVFTKRCASASGARDLVTEAKAVVASCGHGRVEAEAVLYRGEYAACQGSRCVPWEDQGTQAPQFESHLSLYEEGPQGIALDEVVGQLQAIKLPFEEVARCEGGRKTILTFVDIDLERLCSLTFRCAWELSRVLGPHVRQKVEVEQVLMVM